MTIAALAVVDWRWKEEGQQTLTAVVSAGCREECSSSCLQSRAHARAPIPDDFVPEIAIQELEERKVKASVAACLQLNLPQP